MTTTSSTPSTPDEGAAPRFLLLGDSHAGAIARASAGAGVPCLGGPIGSGRDFTADFFDVGERGVSFRSAEAERLYRGFLDELGAPDLGDVRVPLVCTFGLSVHFYATTENWNIYRETGGGFPAGFLRGSLFTAIVRTMARGALAFYEYARRRGLRTVAVMGPVRVPGIADPSVFLAAQDVMREALLELGVELVDLRARVVDETGFQRPELCDPNDPIHGSLGFGRLIVTDLLERGL